MKVKYDKVLGTIREDDLDGGTIAVDASFTGNVDIGDASSDSLTILSTIDAPVLFADGTAALPSITFGTDLNTGIFRLTADELSLGAGGTEGLRIDANESEVQPMMTLASGPIELEEDAGAVILINLPVSATPADEVVESYGFSVDSNVVATIQASADSTGGVYGERLKIDSSIFVNDAQTFVDSDATPDVRGYTNWETNTTGVTITDFDWGGKTIPEGQILIVVSKGVIVWDVTGQGLKGGTTDITTATGDVTTFMYDGADWLITSRIDQSDDLN